MHTTRTTPPRPLDVAAVFPELGPLARPAVRLHPRPGSPTPHDSSVGGPLLWPARHPWPLCDRWHEGPPAPMLPLVQLYARDVPLMAGFGRADLLQVLWCPREHIDDYKPSTEVFWRASADVTDVRTEQPGPEGDEDYDPYVPRPCVLSPEAVTEYPDHLDLDAELQRRLEDPDAWRAAGAPVDASYEDEPQRFYINELSRAPGWKFGGWPPWGRTDPVVRFCPYCGDTVVPLLTVASQEWDSERTGWVPHEDRDLLTARGPWWGNPVGAQIGDNDNLQIYVCPRFPGGTFPYPTATLLYPGGSHSHTALVQ